MAIVAGIRLKIRPPISASKYIPWCRISPTGWKVQHDYPSHRKLFSSFRRLNSAAWALPDKMHIRVAVDTKERDLPLHWLRDHCHCKHCVNQDTMQKAFDTFSVPHGLSECGQNESGIWAKWQDQHYSEYTWEWINANAFRGLDPLKTQSYTYWGSEIREEPPSVSYKEIMDSDSGVGKWTAKIRQYGFCFVDGCPVSPEKTQELLERIAFIRITHYGGFYDFTSDLTMKDTAYTSLALPAHTDNTYFTDPCGLQMFHLLSHTAGTGGSSLLVDGFHCCELLKKADMEAYRILATTPINWHASGNDGIIITPRLAYPVFSQSPTNYSLTNKPALVQIRWNNDDRATMPLDVYYQSKSSGTGPSKSDWYDAARLWDSILKDQKNEYWEQLVPGRPLIFDNWRVLHGRSAFTGKRRICGGYVNRDDFISRYLNTNFSREEVLRRII